MEQYTQTLWPNWAYAASEEPFPTRMQLSPYASCFADSMEAAYQNHQQHLVHHHQMSRTTESKPRLSKEEVEILEAEFQKNHKPNSTTKKALAESMRVENARINNWFQNRRAREKKENNIRQYEAKQKSLGPQIKSEFGSDDESDGRSDLVSSSAPFPGRRRASINQVDTPATSLDQSTTDKDSSSTPCDPASEGPSPAASHMSASWDEAVPSRSALQQDEKMEQWAALVPDSLAVPQANVSLHAPLLSADSEALFELDDASCGFFFGPFNAAPTSDYANAESPLACTDRLRSPPPLDIASRRNRRPPHLALTGSRSFSSIPKSALDLQQRREARPAMRRVASVNGPSRVAKPANVPRSPFYDRQPDALFHLNRSPGLAGPRATATPPTPDTPMITAHQGYADGYSSALHLDDKFSAELATYDATLRTPPTTPGLVENLQKLNSGYGRPFPCRRQPARSGFGAPMVELDGLGAPMFIPEYLNGGNGCSSQPQTPLFPPHIDSSYVGFPSGGGDCSWLDVQSSDQRSAVCLTPTAQFMSMASSMSI